MTSRRSYRALLAALLTAGVSAAQTGTPSVFSLSPSSVPAGSGGFSLSVIGSNFQNGAAVNWNGFPLPTNFVSSGQLVATVQSNLISSPSFAVIGVANPGGIQSNRASFAVTASPLSISISGVPAGVVGTPFAANLVATGGTPPYTWAAASSLPPGLTVNPNGSVTGTPTASGSYTVSIRVTDSQQGTASSSFALTITGPTLSIVTPSPLASTTAGQAYTQAMIASGGVPPYSWSAGAGIPAGLTINPTTGVISGAAATAGTFSFPVQVTDSNRLVTTQSFTLVVNPPPLIITTAPPLFNGIVGTPYAQTFSASGGKAPYQWSIISGNSGGLTVDPGSGTLQGTPQTAGAFTFTLQVADSAGTRVSQLFTVTVVAPSLTIVTGAALPGGSVGITYSQQFSVVGGTPPYAWSLTTGNVPGLAFNAGQAILSGAPTAPGSFSLTLQVRDSGSSTVTATRTFTITINPAAFTIITGTQLPDGVLGGPYSYQMSASGGVPPYTWSANGLPDGLTIDPTNGTISGTLAAAGPAPFAVRAIDSARASATDQFRINVSLPPAPGVRISGLPSTVGPAQQFSLQIALDATFPVAISGQAILTFSPEVGGGDGTIQFSTGGSTANFTIPAGSASSPQLAIQTGTVAGQIVVSLRLQAGGQDLTPTPAPGVSAHIDQAAPVIQSASFTRSGNGISIQIVGFATAREVTQATFAFDAASGQTLQSSASQITIPVETLFNTWFQNSTNNTYGSQFSFSQPFSIQGDVTSVTPQTVTLTNRKGSTTFPISK